MVRTFFPGGAICTPNSADMSLLCSRLVKMNRIEEAREVFSAMYEEPTGSPIVNSQIRDIQLSLELGQNSSIKAMFQMGPQRTFHRVLLAATIQMYLQMSGVK